MTVQWLGLHAFSADGPGSIPDGETRIPQTHDAAEKKKKNHVFQPEKICFFTAPDPTSSLIPPSLGSVSCNNRYKILIKVGIVI